jgi:hypothetical protein
VGEELQDAGTIERRGTGQAMRAPRLAADNRWSAGCSITLLEGNGAVTVAWPSESSRMPRRMEIRPEGAPSEPVVWVLRATGSTDGGESGED